MRLQGTVTELDTDIEEYDHDVDDAIVTKSRISIDWAENGQRFHAVMNSNDGGVTYKGNYGSPTPVAYWTMSATKYRAADGSMLLIVKWYQKDNGRGGVCLIELFAAE